MSRLYLYSMEPKLDELLTVRMDTETYLEFQAACKLRGASMSSIVHQYAVSVIYDEKTKHLERFNVALEKYREKLRVKRADAAAKKARKATRHPETLTISPHDIGAIADATGIDDYTIMRYLNNDLAGIAPQDIQRIQNAMREPATEKIVSLGDKLANGKR